LARQLWRTWSLLPYSGGVTDVLMEWLRGFGGLSLISSVAVVLLFVIAAFVFIPRTFLTLGVAGIYGFSAIPLVMIGATTGSILAFLLARYLFSDRVQRWIDRHRSLRAIANAVDAEGWRVVALLRFASPTPSSVQNYVFGITRIGFWPYALATFIFTMPQTVLYAYLGAAGRSFLVADVSSPFSQGLMLIGAGCLAATAFLIWRKARALSTGQGRQC
jgi:uncharacterized membrane protein YdjX (TVP38/TMEM64 family)